MLKVHSLGIIQSDMFMTLMPVYSESIARAYWSKQQEIYHSVVLNKYAATLQEELQMT